MVGRFSTAAGSTGRADSAEVTPSLPLRWNSFPGCLWLHPYPGARKLFLFLPHPFTSGDTFRLPVSEMQRGQSARSHPSPTPGADPEVPCWRAVEAAAGWVQGRPPRCLNPSPARNATSRPLTLPLLGVLCFLVLTLFSTVVQNLNSATPLPPLTQGQTQERMVVTWPFGE